MRFETPSVKGVNEVDEDDDRGTQTKKQQNTQNIKTQAKQSTPLGATYSTPLLIFTPSYHPHHHPPLSIPPILPTRAGTSAAHLGAIGKVVGDLNDLVAVLVAGDSAVAEGDGHRPVRLRPANHPVDHT